MTVFPPSYTNAVVNVWTVILPSDPPEEIKVATVEQPGRRPGVCEDCPAPCCNGLLFPVLTSDEFLQKRYNHRFVPAPDWITKKVPGAFIVVVQVEKGGCVYFDKRTNLCTAWPAPPAACLHYDCRYDQRPEFKRIAKKQARKHHNRPGGIFR